MTITATRAALKAAIAPRIDEAFRGVLVQRNSGDPAWDVLACLQCNAEFTRSAGHAACHEDRTRCYWCGERTGLKSFVNGWDQNSNLTLCAGCRTSVGMAQ